MISSDALSHTALPQARFIRRPSWASCVELSAVQRHIARRWNTYKLQLLKTTVDEIRKRRASEQMIE